MTPLSRSGSELVKDLVNQANQIGKSGASPDIVYVLLGGNDICNRAKSTTSDATVNLYPVSKWTQQADAALDALVKNLPAGATVRFLSMPRVDLLYSTLNAARVPINARHAGRFRSRARRRARTSGRPVAAAESERHLRDRHDGVRDDAKRAADRPARRRLQRRARGRGPRLRRRRDEEPEGHPLPVGMAWQLGVRRSRAQLDRDVRVAARRGEATSTASTRASSASSTSPDHVLHGLELERRSS